MSQRIFVGGQSLTLDRTQVINIRAATVAGDPVSFSAGAQLEAIVPVPDGMALVVDGLTLQLGAELYTCRTGTVTRGWSAATGAADAAGSAQPNGRVFVTPGPAVSANAINWRNAALSADAGRLVTSGVFRTAQAPIKPGLSISVGGAPSTAGGDGTIFGPTVYGSVDVQRGLVRWANHAAGTPPGDGVDPASVTYNATYLRRTPLDSALLGLDTRRLPIDGLVPIYRPGAQVLVHHTQFTPVASASAGTTVNLGRTHLAAAVLRKAGGARVPSGQYSVNLETGVLTIGSVAGLVPGDYPLQCEHRVQDDVLLLGVDISGRLELGAPLSRAYPLGARVSSKLRKGDTFARVSLSFEQTAFTTWSDQLQGSAPLANFNEVNYPIAVTNAGAVSERWVVIFTSNTTVRIVGERLGQVVPSADISQNIAPINPATGVPYFTLPALGWGTGWGNGNCLRFNTVSAASPAWVARVVLPGQSTEVTDRFSIAWTGDVDRP